MEYIREEVKIKKFKMETECGYEKEYLNINWNVEHIR